MKKEVNIKTSTNVSMIGVIIVLLSLISILSWKSPLAFLSTGITFVFGFVGYWVLIPVLLLLGIYLIFKKHLIKVKFGLSVLGGIIVVLGLLILTSMISANGYLMNNEEVGFGIKNATEIFKELNAKYVEKGPFTTRIGGGYIGFALAGLLYSGIKAVGLYIVSGLLLAGGTYLLFHRLIKKIVATYKLYKAKHLEHVQLIEQKKEEKKLLIEKEKAEEKAKKLEEKEKEKIKLAPVQSNNKLTPATFDISEVVSKKHEKQNLLKPIAGDDIFNSEVKEEPKVVVKEETPEVKVIEKEEIIEPIIEENIVYSSLDEEEIEIPEQVVEEVKEEPVVIEEVKEEQKPYVYPDLSLLDLREKEDDSLANIDSNNAKVDLLNTIFSDFGIGATAVSYTVGPSVTRFDIQMAPGCSSSLLERYKNDISSRLGGLKTRIELVVAGRPTSGIEVPNSIRTNVGLLESMQKLPEPTNPKAKMTIVFGKNIAGELVAANLANFPHMLVAGTTGSGKSIFIHSTILTLLMRNSPEELRFIMIDPKKVEMNFYNNIPHLLCPNVSDANIAYAIFNKLVDEMENRLTIYQATMVRDIDGYNKYAIANNSPIMPRIVVFIDEFADLVDQNKNIKEPVGRLAQKARAVGIHLVVATQRPSVNIIEGVIKSNIGTRVALKCSSFIDSKTIIDVGGAETLLGNGDMLVQCDLVSTFEKPRVQGCYVSEEEIQRVCDFVRSNNKVVYDEKYLNLDKANDSCIEEGEAPAKPDKELADDQLFEYICENIGNREYVSMSYIQRTFDVGFNRAGKMHKRLLDEGILDAHDVSPNRGNRVLIKKVQQQQIGSYEQSTFIPNKDNNEE